MNEAESLEQVIALAEKTPLARSRVLSLVSQLPEALEPALEIALEQSRTHAATVLTFAIAASGGTLSASSAAQLIPDLESLEHLPAVASMIRGDRVAGLLEALETGRMSWEREALVLYLAAVSLDGAEAPGRLVAHLRTLSREPMSPQAGMLVALAARELGNAAVDAVAAPLLPFADFAMIGGLGEQLRRAYFGSPLDSLSEDAGRLVSGYTVVRGQPKVGRNDPCPCGSGRKYKKCCAAREEDPPAAPSPLEQFQRRVETTGRSDQNLFELLRPADLARLAPECLTTLQLIGGARDLARHHRWEA